MYFKLVLITFICASYFCPAKACNGYSVKLNHYSNCVNDPVIKLPAKGANVVLDKDCNVILTGCLEITKPFKTAKGTYSIKKSPLPPMDGDLDFCEIVEGLDDPRVNKVASMYGMPSKCPVPQKKICGTNNQKISIAQFRNQIGMAAGTTEIKVEVDHDTGKSCIEAGVTITKARSG